MKRLCWALVAALVLATLGCGKAPLEVLEEYRPKIEAFEAKLARVKTKIAAATGHDCPKALSPAPVFSERFERPGWNTNFLMFDELTDPFHVDPPEWLPVPEDRRGHGRSFTFLNDAVRSARQRYSVDGYYKPEEASSAAGAILKDDLDRALAVRYLVVVRIEGLTAPRRVGETSFVPGLLTVGASVVDLETEEIACSVAVAVTSSDKVQLRSEKLDADYYLTGDLMTAAKAQFYEELGQRAGFELIPY